MMKNCILKLLVSLAFSAVPAVGEACTSMIISSRVTADGRPLMFKHRDSSKKDVHVQYFHGPKFDFIGIADAGAEPGQVWAGTNGSGFSIMNTASYNFKEDDIPDSKMNCEGVLMFEALGRCRTVADFEHLLDTLPRPLRVEANFGVIDAEGGACYFEVNNTRYVKFDVNDEEASPYGYRIVTNYCISGRREDDKGVERQMTALEIMRPLLETDRKTDVTPQDIFSLLSRSYKNSFTGLDYVRDYRKLVSKKTGIAVDQDFIPRRSTSCSVVFHGVRPGSNPLSTVMWTVLGYPACAAAFPLMVGETDILPDYVKPDAAGHSQLCDIAMDLKSENVFKWNVSNGSHYMDMESVVKGRDGRQSLLKCANAADQDILREFAPLYKKWEDGSIGDKEFFKAYYDKYYIFLHLYFINYKEYSLKITKLAQ